MQLNQVQIPDRVRNLASVMTSPLGRIRSLLSNAAEHYRNVLRSSPNAINYLQGRGIGGAVAARYGLGYSTAAWHGLRSILTRYGESTIHLSGLVVAKGQGAVTHRFDRFRGRVMFPIRTRDGFIVGFGGRTINQTDAKYINSPEGVMFQKRDLLYGLYEAQHAIRCEGSALVVEGYFDVLMLAQAGYNPVVGTLGTACTRSQIASLLSLTRKVIFCFDGDEAGRCAAERALQNVLPSATNDHSFHFVFLPERHDPDSFVRANGIEQFKVALAGAMSLIDFIKEQITVNCDLRYAEGRSRCASQAQQLWKTLPDGEVRDNLLTHCASLIDIPPIEMRSMWEEAC